MKHSAKILSFVMVLLMALGVFTVFTMMPQEAYAASVTTKIDTSTQGYANGGAVTKITSGNVTVEFNKGTNSNAPKYYSTGTAVRVYGGGYFTVSVPQGYKISQITLTFGSGDGSNTISTDVGSFSSSSWSGSAMSVKFMIGGSSGHRRIKTISVTYDTIDVCQHTNTVAVGTAKEASCTEDGITAGKKCSACNVVIEAPKTISATGHNYQNRVCTLCGEEMSTNGNVSVNIQNHASQNGWTNGTQYTSIKMNDIISVTTSTSGNTGKFYTAGYNWRFYQTDSSTLTVTAAEGVVIDYIIFTYVVENTGTFLFNGSNIASGDKVIINASSATFKMGNTGNATNGQVRITNIEVSYKAFAPCTHENTTTTTNEASCKDMGLTTVTCDDCGEIVSQSEIPATGHAPAEAVVENFVDSTCSAVGSYDEIVYCSVCKETLSRTEHTVDKKEHTPSEVVVENKVSAECEKDGSYDNVVYCSVCEAEISRNSMTIPKTGHSYDDGVVTAPTFDAQGFTTYTCENCGDSYVDENSYAAALVAVASVDGTRYESLQEAVNNANGGTVKILADIVLDASIKIDGLTVTIDLNGYTITASYTAGNTALVDDMVEVILAKNGANVTITGNGSMVANGKGEHVEVISAIDGAKVTIENGSFVSAGCTAIYATRGAVVTINGGFFEAKETFGGKYYTLDINEAEETHGQIIVYGGTFANFNPANHTNDGKDNGNKLAKGFHAIKNDSDAYVVSAHSYDDGVCDCGFIVKFNSASITLQDNLLVNFKLDMASLARAGIEVLQVYINGQIYEVEGESVFSVAIAPHQMNDEIIAYFIFSDHNGAQESKHIHYSVATYCYNKIGDADLHDLIVSILNYGAAAQVAIGYNVDHLANANLSDTEKVVGNVEAEAFSEQSEVKEEYSVLWTAAGLLLNDKIVIRFAFEAEDVEGLAVKVEINGRTYTVEEFVGAGENRYYVYIEGLNATQLRNKVSVTVMDGENAVSTTLTYSVEVYATKVFGYAEVEGYENLVSLVKAMMVYGDAAKAYVGK